MSETVDDVKAAVREFLRARFQPVQPARADNKKVHLEVWETQFRSRAVGLEFDHDDRVNFWVTSINVPPVLPPSIKASRKTPKGPAWTDENGDGANSNLSAYDEFRTKPLARLGVTSTSEAMLILDHLTR